MTEAKPKPNHLVKVNVKAKFGIVFGAKSRVPVHEKHGLSSVRQRKLVLLILWGKELFDLKFWIRVDLGSKNIQRQLS